jgi:hypothetical protein
MSNEWFETVAVAQRRAKKRLPKSVYWSVVDVGHAVDWGTAADPNRRIRADGTPLAAARRGRRGSPRNAPVLGGSRWPPS